MVQGCTRYRLGLLWSRCLRFGETLQIIRKSHQWPCILRRLTFQHLHLLSNIHNTTEEVVNAHLKSNQCLLNTDMDTTFRCNELQESLVSVRYLNS
jgi:hypothetical protein